MLTKEQILGKDDSHILKLEIPEWDGYVYVRAFSLGERQLLFQDVKDKDPLISFVNIIAAGVCNEKGERLFSEDEAKLLISKNAAALQRCKEAIWEINGLNLEVEAVKKN